MQITSDQFNRLSAAALSNEQLRTAFSRASSGFIDKRKAAIARITNFDELRTSAAAIKDHTLAQLDYYLEQFSEQARANGAQVHLARDGEELNSLVIDLAKRHNVRQINKGKSMVSEETRLNQALRQANMEVTETDLGEYILQLAEEQPSHIIAPAIHKTREEIAALFHKRHGKGYKEEAAELVEEARRILRKTYLSATMGITGANFLIAENGAMMLVTNEGNGDLCASLPPIHLVVTGIEKVIPSMKDAFALLRLLTNSATGQAITSYVTVIRAPARKDDSDGPTQLHYILLDNGRSKIRQSKYRSILRCIRCGACLNHCPVYSAVGGHSYGSVYPGPLGAVLTPLLADRKKAAELPNASSFCGRCEQVCPVAIPLVELMRQLRNDQHKENSLGQGWGIAIYMKIARSSFSYRLFIAALRVWLRLANRFPPILAIAKVLPPLRAWTEWRQLPQPQNNDSYRFK